MNLVVRLIRKSDGRVVGDAITVEDGSFSIRSAPVHRDHAVQRLFLTAGTIQIELPDDDALGDYAMDLPIPCGDPVDPGGPKKTIADEESMGD